jgi:hypothetical protein
LPSKTKTKVREANFSTAYAEVGLVLKHMDDINLLYLKPMRLQEEQNAFRKAADYLGKAYARLNKRIEISRKLNS